MHFLRKKVILATHNGSFHADDVFACAALSVMLEQQGLRYRVIRTRDADTLSLADYVFDVGGVLDEETRRFDHHQRGGAGVRENGIPYASAGLVWKTYGENITGDKEAALAIEQMMVMPIDAFDNGLDFVDTKITGVYPFSFQTIINIFRPTWQETDITDDAQFLKAVALMKDLLERAIVVAKNKAQSRRVIEDVYAAAEDKSIVIFDRNFNRDEILSVLTEKPEPVFFVYPKSDAGWWKAEVVRKSIDTFEARKAFPREWAGKTGNELRELSGVTDAQFCHNGQFLCTASSKEGAILLAKEALRV